MTTTIFKKPRYQMITELAYELLDCLKITELPIKIKEVIKQFPNLFLMSYSEYAKKYNLTIEQVAEQFNSQDGSLISRKNKDGSYSHVIFYNDKIASVGRIRFTLAHELGHYILGHTIDSESTRVNQNSLTQKEKEYIETEANYFAKHLLTPFPLIFVYLEKLESINANQIAETFNVSHTMSEFVIRHVKTLHEQYQFHEISHPLVSNFETYIEIDTSYYSCPNCHILSKPMANHCHICGIKFLPLNSEDKLNNYIVCKSERNMKCIPYKRYELDNFGFPNECPHCREEVDKTDPFCPFCKKCNLIVQNICLGDIKSPMEFIQQKELTSVGCGTALYDDSRYCHNCSGISSYAATGLLHPLKNITPLQRLALKARII